MILAQPIWFNGDGDRALLATFDDPTTLSLNFAQLSSRTHTWNFFRSYCIGPWSPLMLRIMAGDHQSAATAPLDLRTTIRERGTPDCKGRIVAAAPLACTGTDRLEKHSPAVQATLVSLGRGASHKRKTDSSPCSLPLRKRKIHFEPETPTQSPTPPSGDRFSPPVDADITCRESFAGQARDKSTVAPAYVAHRRIEEPGQSQNGYPIHLFYQLDYGKRVWI